MNYLEGLRRLTVIISVIAAILTSVYFVVVDNSAQQKYSQLSNAVTKIELQKELLTEKNNDYVKNYLAALKKVDFQNLKIIEVNDQKQNQEYTVLWPQEGLPQENEMDILITNKLYLDGNGYEKDTAKLLLGYLTELNDLSAIKSKLTIAKLKKYLVPILYGACSFMMVWIIFYSIRYVTLGFKKEM